MDQGEKVEKVIRTPSELPIGWKKAPLIEIAEIIMGQSPPSEYYNTNGEGLPFFQGKAEFGDLYPESVKWCSEPSKVAQKDDILISVRAPVGPTNLAPNECCIGRGLAAIRPRDGIPSKYLLYYLRNIESSLDELGTGTTFKAISGNVLRSIPVPVAPSEQQEGIVAEIEKQFSRLDGAVANLKRVKANLKRYKAAVLKAAVDGKLTEDWRKANPDVEPASELLKRILAERRANWNGKRKYKEPTPLDTTDLAPLPESWTWTTVEHLSNVVRGASPRPAGDPKYFGGNIPWITVGSITADRKPYLKSVTETVTEAGRDRSRYIEAETLLLTNSGATLGVPKITLIGGCINDGVAALLNVDYPLKLYLLYFLHSQTDRLRGVNQGAAQPNLNTTIIKAINVPLPSLAEQERILAEVQRRLSVVEESEGALEANFQRANRLRQSLLQKAFNGSLIQ